ncbi:HEAT repeat domain-containing protein [Lusitaniella coriacea LEGE 07157]|uniref:HEAT repeat domain-containing protein n=1 Tax=Lusitaniella coriacea LEGE 07157 TaxID=945747 RepID=A0A8J7IT47_9CYAN|nr:HEAT repeat domain-containing protein [Lusitaniella coriacea]MBE9115633.1 HEAT repeat domain-containing protein [Lusitaniella coriacea LEGE 07157]
MNHGLNTEGDLNVSQAKVDKLVRRVNEQQASNTFDSTDRATLKQLVESFADSRGMVRLRIAETLGEIGKPAVPELVEGLTHHSNPVVRRACAKTLTLIADPSSIPSLIDALLKDEDTVVKGSSVGALARIGEASVPVLIEILASSQHPESMKGHAAWALAFIGAEAKEAIYQEISSDFATVRAAVVGAISNIAEGDPEERAFKILVNSLEDPAVNVRSEAAAALGKLNYQPAIPKLLESLHHENGETRKSAALALMKMGDRATIEPLQNAMTEESEESVKKAIALAISQIERRLEAEDG